MSEKGVKIMNNQNAKADKGKPKLSLVPTEIINCIARCREYGTMKYHDPNNWKDVEKERYIDAAYRHWIKYVADNNSVDEESGLPHLWHCATNLAFLCEFDKIERETKEMQQAIQRVEAKEHQDRKHISAPPEVIKNVLRHILAEDCKKYAPHIKTTKEKNCRNCQYWNGKRCTAYPDEHKECE